MQASARTSAEAISLMLMRPLVVAWASSLNGAWIPRSSILRESQMEEATSPVIMTLPQKSYSVTSATFGLLEVSHQV